MDDLSLALQRFDLEAYAAEFGAVREGTKEVLLECPHCGKVKLSVNVGARRWRCFGCEQYGRPGATGRRTVVRGAGGVFSLVQWLERLSPGETARRILALARPAEVRPGDPIAPVEFRSAPAEILKHPTGLPENCVAISGTLPYLEKRGITLEDTRTFGLGYVPPGGGWLANRIVFPVWERGQCLYWQARACWDEEQHVPRWPGDKFRKSLNPLTERNGTLFLGSSDVVGNLEQAARYPRVAIVEGPTSGVRTGPSAVWTFGKSISPAQVARLIQAGVRAVDFLWDGPSPGKGGQGSGCACHGNPGCAWEAMLRAAPLLAASMDVRIVFLPEGDPGDYSRAQLAEFRAQARPWADAAREVL